MITAAAPISWMRRAAARVSAGVVMRTPLSASASGMFGVTTRASGINASRSAATPSSSSRREPLDETRTGSRTTSGRSSSSIAAATASTMALVASMPILVAAMSRSPASASICAVTRSAESGATPSTPFVLCTVIAVIALAPYTPNAANVFRSAWMPAPPLGSLPAIVSAVRIR